MRCRERGQIIDSKCDKCQKHITLICQHDKLPLVIFATAIDKKVICGKMLNQKGNDDL